MRRIRYCVASSLDGYIAGPEGEFDWIIMDPDIDFTAIFAQFDTFLVGRHTFKTMAGAGGAGPGRTLVFSRTLRQQDHPGVTIVADRIPETLNELRAQPGKDIWLFGGGSLFQSLLALGQVDTVEVAIIPVLLGGGIPLLPAPAARRELSLTGHRVYGSGIVSLEYAVGSRGAQPASTKSAAGKRSAKKPAAKRSPGKKSVKEALKKR
ncbi:MAG: dihydrofolate reductase family protein [Gemmatimonadetes bacterium]|nr:dihydrofolate reductase family protein [Gemmatimonadota bacterium]